MLAAYCRHACRSRWLAGQIDAYADKLVSKQGGVQILDKMLAMAERESRVVLAHARSLRLTNQSRYDARAAGRTAAPSGRYYDSMEMDPNDY